MRLRGSEWERMDIGWRKGFWRSWTCWEDWVFPFFFSLFFWLVSVFLLRSFRVHCFFSSLPDFALSSSCFLVRCRWANQLACLFPFLTCYLLVLGAVILPTVFGYAVLPSGVVRGRKTAGLMALLFRFKPMGHISTLSLAGLLGWDTGKRDSVDAYGLWFALVGGPCAFSSLSVGAVGVAILGTDFVFGLLVEG